MTNDLYGRRKELTFAQAERASPLPRQLALKEVSRELRALLWSVFFSSMSESILQTEFPTRRYFDKPWSVILFHKHVYRDHKMADEFGNSYPGAMEDVKQTFLTGDYVAIFDFIEWVLRRKDCPIKPSVIQNALVRAGSAYRLLDDNKTIVPISSEQEQNALNLAFANLSATAFAGPVSIWKRLQRHLLRERQPIA